MTRLLAAFSLAALLAVPVASAPAADSMPVPDCHGVQVTDKAGDSVNSLDGTSKGNPSSDLIGAFITYDGAGDKAQANIQVDNLTVGEVDPPYTAISWEMAFNTTAGARYVRAYEDISGIVKYNWGEPRAITDDQTAPRVGGDTTGKLFPGKGGVIQIDIPLKDVGAAVGSQLKGIALEVRQWGSLPAAVPSTGLPLYSPAPIYDDATGKGAYTVGPCGATPAAGAPGGPPPPAPSTSTPPAPGTAGQPAGLGVKVTVPSLKAKSLAKKKKFTIKLSGTASSLVATVRKDPAKGKALASGKLAALKGSGKLTLKGKLKKGTYVLTVVGKNAQGQPAEGAVKIKVK